MKRIEHLRSIALDATPTKDAFDYTFFKWYHANSKEKDEYARYATSFYSAYSDLIPQIMEDELIVGGFTEFASPDDKTLWEEKYRALKNKYQEHTIRGMSGHMAIDYELLLSKGITGVIEIVKSYLKTCTPDKAPFYKACMLSLEAVINHSKNYACEAKRLACITKDEVRKNELLTLAGICEKVPANPAGNFYEAVQSVYFLTYCLTQNPFYGIEEFQYGHPDRYLLPYYKKDIENGAITKEFAQLLLDCLGIKMNMLVPNGWAVGYMVGGRDENGEVVANELTEMCMQVIEDIRLVHPSVGLCYTSDMPENYLETACRILLNGRSHPAIFNNDVITKGLMSYGVPEKRARNYIQSTCVEITPVGASNVWVASHYNNMAQLLLDALDKDYASFDSLLKAVFKNIDEKIKKDFLFYDDLRRERGEYSMFPLQSCFIDDCLLNGVDLERGGAVYNWTMQSFVGLGNLVDSLYTIKELVFDKKELSISQFKKIIDSNYEGNEMLRLQILNTIPKYGNDIDDVDELCGIITEHIIKECEKYKGHLPNSTLIPSTFSYTWHTRFGKITGATPDGRKSGEPLSAGAEPCQGRELKGPTASIKSTTKWDQHRFIGGVAVNMKFSKNNLSANSLEIIKALVKAFMFRGGFEIQINVTDKETLKKAKENPEAHRDLLVRIGGYSDYFTRLSPEMQEEVISRTEHNL